MPEGPQFIQFFGPVLDALRALGGSARPSEVEEWVVNECKIPSSVQDELLASGGSRLRNQIHWARFYLAKADLLDSSVRGVWSLTEKGLATHLDIRAAQKLFRAVHAQFGAKQPGKGISDGCQDTGSDDSDMDDAVDRSDYRSQLNKLLGNLPPEGFERLCQRVLRESGFENVKVTGRSGDGGIDGHGVLRVNPLVSFYVYFQCKRYAHPVGPSVIRDFRGAMMGRADKGIILTTATFTSDARKEAVRDGVPPIELVDGESFISMLANLGLGLVPRTTYELDERFFVEFGYELPGIARK